MFKRRELYMAYIPGVRNLESHFRILYTTDLLTERYPRLTHSLT